MTSTTPRIRASELVARRQTEAMAALQRAIEQREQAIVKLARIHAKIWKLGRQVQRYEKLTLPPVPSRNRRPVQLERKLLPPAPLRKRK